jgi:hypothetical protein
MNIIEECGNLSGLKLNKNKTEGIWIGRLKHTKDKYENISWNNGPFKSLGVYFEYNKTQCDRLNYEKQINKCKAIIKNEPEKHLISRKDNSVQITNTAQHNIYRFLHHNTKRIYPNL